MIRIACNDLFSLINELPSAQAGGTLDKKEVLTFNAIAIVGSSCAGKTTMIRKIKSSSLCKAGRISVPVRYTTRSGRMNDAPGENSHLSRADFGKKIKQGKIAFYWKKRMDARSEEIFGFGPPRAGVVPVYSGNNGLLFNRKTVFPKSILKTTLFIGIYAPDEVRRERLLKRSPDIARNKPQELKYRLEDSAEKVLCRVPIVVNNYGPLMKRSVLDIVELVERMVNSTHHSL